MDCGVCESTGYACDLKVDGGLSKMTLWKCNCWENRSSKEALKLSNMTLRLFEISFKKKHIIEHQLPLPAAMCFVRNHTGRLQECQTWIPSSINRISDSKSRMSKFWLADFFKLEELRTCLKPHKAACGGRLWPAKTLENWRHTQGIRKI